MAIGNGELVHECFPKHSRMGTARTKRDKEIDEGSKKRGVSMEKPKRARKNRSPDGLSHPNQNTIIIIVRILQPWTIFQRFNSEFL